MQNTLSYTSAESFGETEFYQLQIAGKLRYYGTFFDMLSGQTADHHRAGAESNLSARWIYDNWHWLSSLAEIKKYKYSVVVELTNTRMHQVIHYAQSTNWVAIKILADRRSKVIWIS